MEKKMREVKWYMYCYWETGLSTDCVKTLCRCSSSNLLRIYERFLRSSDEECVCCKEASFKDAWKNFGFLPPPPPQIHATSLTKVAYYVCFWRYPLPPQCGRHKWKPPYIVSKIQSIDCVNLEHARYGKCGLRLCSKSYLNLKADLFNEKTLD